MEIRKFEQILYQFKEETRRLSSAKSRVDDAEMAQKTPKLRIREFLRHTLNKVVQLHTNSATKYGRTCLNECDLRSAIGKCVAHSCSQFE